MTRLGLPLLGIGVGLLLAPWACDHTEPFPDPSVDADLDVDVDLDADVDADLDADADVDSEPDADADEPPVDGDVPSGPGPITLVVTEGGLTTARMCDLDGDGDLDNVFADLGSPSADLAVMALNSILQGSVETGARRVLHFPWVDDRAGPTDPRAVLINFDVIDGDDPEDRTDDLLGGEGFWVDPDHLDACGEPRYYVDSVAIDEGLVSSEPGTLLLPLGDDIVTRGARAMGRVDPGGLAGEIVLCAYSTISDLGGQPGLGESGDLTMLEVFLAGGDAFGVPMIPGFRPDLDLDHDGLESFVLDADQHLAQCVDGDLTVLEGRDCWQDERFADGFSLNLRFVGVHALLLGRYPGWEDLVEGTCDDPPEESLFDRR